MKELYPFTLDPDGSQRDAFRAYLVATLTYQRFRGVRMVLIYALVFIGFLMWFAEGWPRLLPDVLSRVLWDSWMAGLLGALIAAGLEWTWRREQMRCISRLGQPFKENVRPTRGP